MARTKGSKNKAKAEFDQKLDRACSKRIVGYDANGRPIKFDLVNLLIDVAAGVDETEKWSKGDRLSAAKALLDKRYPNKREHSGSIEGSEMPTQLVITYDDSQRGQPVPTPISTMGAKG